MACSLLSMTTKATDSLGVNIAVFLIVIYVFHAAET